jgi:hypothetical protein
MWDDRGAHHQVPAIAHAAWRAPDGRIGIVLANWTNEDITVTVPDERLGNAPIVHTYGRGAPTSVAREPRTLTRPTVPALGCVLLEGPTPTEDAE